MTSEYLFHSSFGDLVYVKLL